MFDEKNIFKFFCALLWFFSIIIDGPIIPIISFAIGVGLLIHKIKRAKESPDGMFDAIFDLIVVIILIVTSIGVFMLRVSIEDEYEKFDYSSSSSQKMDPSEFAENAIFIYKLEHLAQFRENENHLEEIKNGFYNYLSDELELTDIQIKNNKIICPYRSKTITFAITRKDITFTIK